MGWSTRDTIQTGQLATKSVFRLLKLFRWAKCTPLRSLLSRVVVWRLRVSFKSWHRLIWLTLLTVGRSNYWQSRWFLGRAARCQWQSRYHLQLRSVISCQTDVITPGLWCTKNKWIKTASAAPKKKINKKKKRARGPNCNTTFQRSNKPVQQKGRDTIIAAPRFDAQK